MAACFLCAGVVLPDLDAALFHGLNQEESKPHIEATGAEGCHGESCVLGAVLPQGQRSSSIRTDLTKLSEITANLPSSAASISDRTPAGSPDSRAPPVLTVS